MRLSQAVATFLKPLNSGGPGLETFPVQEARAYLVGAQASVKVDLSGIDESENGLAEIPQTRALILLAAAELRKYLG